MITESILSDLKKTIIVKPMRIIPDINVGAIHKPLLNVLKELVDNCLECGKVLGVGGAMVAEHLGAENSCELT